MGWAKGSRVFSAVIAAVISQVPDKETRKRIYKPIIEAFDDVDWDTHSECLGEDPAYDELYEEESGPLE